MSPERAAPGRSSRAHLTGLFRTDTQAKIVSAVYLSDRMWTAAELARRVGVSRPVANDEVRRLIDFGLVDVETEGRSRRIGPVADAQVRELMTQLALRSYGPVHVVEQEFTPLAGVDHLAIYGSWAARYHGVAGHVPRDVDVLVVGDVERTDLYQAAERATARLGIEVNPHLVSAAAWQNPTGAFLTHVKTQPRVDVITEGHTHDLESRARGNPSAAG